VQDVLVTRAVLACALRDDRIVAHVSKLVCNATECKLTCTGAGTRILLRCVNVFCRPFAMWRARAQGSRQSRARGAVLVRGKDGSAAEVLTTEHDTSPAKDDVTLPL
jgi:hypothetical protein